jgi:ribonuclease D
VLEEEFGVRLDKSQQRSNWAQRPLSPKQIAYARLDTRFLIPLMESQRKALEQYGTMMIVDSECRRLEALEAPPAESNPDDFVKIKGARTLDPAGASALRELFIMRDKLAEKHDTPPFRILGNKSLLQLAERRPRSERELLRIEGITSRVLTRLGDRLQRALDRAERNGPLERLPATPRRGEHIELDELAVELHERLKRLRRDVSTERQIESSYLLHRSALQRLAAAAPADRGAVEALGVLEPWQMEWFADDIVEVVRRFKDDAARGVIPARRRGRRRGGRGRR